MTDREVSFALHWETSLGDRTHDHLARLLAAAFPGTASFGGGRSWAGARPELRVVGWQEGRPVAHAGVVRRFLRFAEPAASQLVGDVGLVAVSPGRAGRGIGGALLDAVGRTLRDLHLPYGFLTCADSLQPFYRRGGWCAAPQPITSVDIGHRVESGRRNGMVLPLHRPWADWPATPVVRDGQEI